MCRSLFNTLVITNRWRHCFTQQLKVSSISCSPHPARTPAGQLIKSTFQGQNRHLKAKSFCLLLLLKVGAVPSRCALSVCGLVQQTVQQVQRCRINYLPPLQPRLAAAPFSRMHYADELPPPPIRRPLPARVTRRGSRGARSRSPPLQSLSRLRALRSPGAQTPTSCPQ